MTHIVYTSNTGFTAEYAKMLSEECGLPMYTLEEAQRSLTEGSEIIFMSWLMAGRVTDYKKAAELFEVKAVCAVGLCATGTLTEETRRANAIPESTAVFTLQGGYAPEKLKGMNKFIMKLVTKALMKKIDKMEAPAPADRQMRETLRNGGSYVCRENLKAILDFID